ncbi:MAG: T9SS type A sorting domain-containing protein [Crocinitomicaceae bacterium]|nr:T9SS type A sorting domain-containing protein [Crocinitomicaceae bacterium]
MYQKVLFSAIFALFISVNSFGQQTINGSMMYGGIQRTYILYVPANYVGTEAVPLLFNFHGYTSNASQQMWYGDFRPIADTAGFILVHPEGTVDNTGATHFNVGWGTSSVNDIGFTSALIDSLSVNYNLDQERIYSTGMSNGGFMSFHLACELSDRIAAVGSVTGSMTLGSFPTCNATHPTPVLQIHGTADGTVTYTGTAFSEPVISVVDFWADFNNCGGSPTIENVPNTSTTDGTTVEKFTYSNGDNCSEVIHYKITNGSHTWAGALFPSAGTNYDISASVEIWNFVSKYDINGKIDCATNSIDDEDGFQPELSIYPNPASSQFSIDGLNQESSFELVSVLGERVLTGKVSSASNMIAVSELKKGVYFLKIEGSVFELVVD